MVARPDGGVAISAGDDSGSVAVQLVSVTSSQADSGLAKDDVSNDIQQWTIGTDDRSGRLRAERFGRDAFEPPHVLIAAVCHLRFLEGDGEALGSGFVLARFGLEGLS